MRRLALFVLLASSFGLLSCSSDENDVEVTFSPEEPVVIESTLTFTVGVGEEINTVVIEGPWFQSSYNITNKSEQDLVIVAIIFRVEKFNLDGTISETTSEFDPGDLPVNNNADVADDQLFLDVIPAGAVFSSNVSIFASGLPKAAEANENLNYNVTADVQGWFGSPTSPEKSFRKEVIFRASE